MPSVVIAGAGVFGASLARQLAGESWDVTLVDPRPPGHPAATSGGGSRFLRCAHGADAWHARLARRARELWQEVGDDVYVECGVAWFAHTDYGWEASSEETLSGLGIPVERVDPREAERLYPDLRTDDLAFVLVEPEAGALRSARATRTLAREAVERGARLVSAQAVPAGAAVDVGPGPLLEADRVVWAAGPWLAGLFPGVVDLRVTRQDVPFLRGGESWRGTPAWVDYDLAAYGCADLDGGDGVKVVADLEGPAFDPDGAREFSPESERRARDYASRRFPSLSRAELVGVEICQYELTADTRFIAAPHPEHPHVWVYGGGSGHGFKHAPALAELMARRLAGEEPPDPALGLGPRTRDVQLRTAGLRADGGAAERAAPRP